nr:putative ribonuclease H-like domain-containing protein [Tanacetum cinerariifolium]
DKTEDKDKGKSPVVTIIRFRDLNAEFEECTNNSSNGVNAASSLVFAAGQKYTNSTNDFSAAGPSNGAMPNLEDLSHDVDDVGLQVKKKKDGIFISQDKYVAKILKNFRLSKGKSATTPIDAEKPLLKDSDGEDRSPKESIKLSRIQVGLKPYKKSFFSSKCKKFRSWLIYLLERGQLEEGIDSEEVFAPVARIEAMRLFLAYASFMGFLVYQMDVKSVFLYGTIEEEVYVCQPQGLRILKILTKYTK